MLSRNTTSSHHGCSWTPEWRPQYMVTYNMSMVLYNITTTTSISVIIILFMPKIIAIFKTDNSCFGAIGFLASLILNGMPLLVVVDCLFPPPWRLCFHPCLLARCFIFFFYQDKAKPFAWISKNIRWEDGEWAKENNPWNFGVAPDKVLNPGILI